MSSKPVIVVGAGLAGSLLSIYLARRGYKVDLYERRPDMRKVSISSGRSINLALSARGIQALKEVGLESDLIRLSIPMPGRMVHPLDGEVNFQPYSLHATDHINSISRGELTMRLMTAAEEAGVRIYFNHRCTAMNLETGNVTFVHEKTGSATEAGGQTVIGADGSASALRIEMMKRHGFNYSQVYQNHGYKELTMPAAGRGGYRIEKNALHIWPRKTYMLIALPNMDGSFTVTLFYPMTGDNSFASLQDSAKVRAFFEGQFPDALPHLPNVLEDYFSNPVGSLVTIKCHPWHVQSKLLLVGDAAHAIVPFFGQGMNCAFEDCSVLNECIGRHEGDWNRVFMEFGELRKANTDAIADLAVENFIEMRDRVSDPKFLRRKQIERTLATAFPEYFVPKYEMVSFHRIPYSIALNRGQIQESILRQLEEAYPAEVDLKAAEALILRRLEPFRDV